MKILILGSNSYFARNFSYYLKSLNSDWYIIGIDVLDNQNEYVNEFYKIDLAKPFDYNFQIILTVNFASLSHVDLSFEHPKMIYDNNINLALNISQITSDKRLIHISTDEVDDVSNPYSISKYTQELILNTSNKSNCFSLSGWAIIRFNNLYSNYTESTYPTQPTIWNVLRTAKTDKTINIVKDYDKITRNFLPVQIACEKLYKFIFSNKTFETIYNGYEISIKDFIKEYENKYQIQFDLNIVPNRKNTDYSYAKIDPIDYNTFIKYL